MPVEVVKEATEEAPAAVLEAAQRVEQREGAEAEQEASLWLRMLT